VLQVMNHHVKERLVGLDVGLESRDKFLHLVNIAALFRVLLGTAIGAEFALFYYLLAKQNFSIVGLLQKLLLFL
jgi:hypothetical protein